MQGRQEVSGNTQTLQNPTLHIINSQHQLYTSKTALQELYILGNRRNEKVHDGKKKNLDSRKKRDLPKSPHPTNRNGPARYTFYSILNTSFSMNQGNVAASIARGLIELCFKLESDEVKAKCFDEWTRHGEKIVILRGYDHKHLKYLRHEVRFNAVDLSTLYRKWGKGHAILVLTVFGQEAELTDAFQGLSILR